MTTANTILKSLDVQDEILGVTEDTIILRKLLPCLKTSSQWQALVKVDFYSYGKLSYQCHRFYHPSKELLAIIDAFSN